MAKSTQEADLRLQSLDCGQRESVGLSAWLRGEVQTSMKQRGAAVDSKPPEFTRNIQVKVWVPRVWKTSDHLLDAPSS